MALMVTESQKSKKKNNQERGNREKKEEKLDISISNHKIGFLVVTSIPICHAKRQSEVLGG